MDSLKFCPGSRSLRDPIPEYIPCPRCGQEVEIWSDEVKGLCTQCKLPVFREKQPSCIDWCPYATKCFGEEEYKRIKGQE